MNTAPPIPKRCAARPRTPAGLVIPYVSVIAPGTRPKDQEALLGEIHAARAAHCLRNGCCQVCGQRLERPFVVLTTAEHLPEQWSSEGPLHPECARYSAAACPMLAGKMATYRQRHRAEGRPCDTPGCDCGGWTLTDPDAISKAGEPAEQWHEVWLDDYAIAVNPDCTIAGASWQGITPRRTRPLTARPRL